MKTNEAVKLIMKQKGIGPQAMATAINEKTGRHVVRQTVSNRLNGSCGFSVPSLLDFAGICGYTLALVEDVESLPPEAIVIDE